MEDSYDVSSPIAPSSWSIFTETHHQSIDSPRLWEGSSSQESDLTAMNPFQFSYDASEILDVCYAEVETTSEDPEATSEVPEATSEVPEATSEVPEATFEDLEATFEDLEATSEDPEATIEDMKVIAADPEATSKFPSTVKFPGDGGFHMHFDESDRESHYLSEMNKMFVKSGTNVAIKFAWDWEKKLIAQPKVRAVLLFQSVQIIDTVIIICPIHKKPADKSNQADHVMRCGHNDAEYLTDPETDRRSVLVPLDPPQTGANTTTIVFSFPCRNSCSQLKKNPTQIVFTLEDSLGKVYGRDVLLIQVSSSPNRDRKKVEQHNETKSAKRRPSTSVVAHMCQKRVKPEKPVGAMDFMKVPVLNEEHYKQVMLLAHGMLLVHIDKEQRTPTDEEIQLLRWYTNDQTSP